MVRPLLESFLSKGYLRRVYQSEIALVALFYLSIFRIIQVGMGGEKF